MRKHMKGYGFYLVIIFILFATIYLSNRIEFPNPDAYSFQKFREDLRDDEIRLIHIYTTSDVP